MKEELKDLITQWEKDAKQYTKQIEECRNKNISCYTMVGHVSILNRCSKELKQVLNKYEDDGK